MAKVIDQNDIWYHEVAPRSYYLGLLDFFRHCIYDGVAEWKAFKLTGAIQPYAIKLLKDGLLRIPIEIKSNKVV